MAKKKRYQKPHRDRAVVDRGSDYVRLRREEITGNASIPGEWPLDVLVALNMITPEEGEAGRDFMNLRFKAFGKPAGWSSGIYRRLQGELPGQDEIEHKPILNARYEAAVSRLKQCGDYALHLTMRVCVYLEVPSWVRKNQPLTALAIYELGALRLGLNALRGDQMRRAA